MFVICNDLHFFQYLLKWLAFFSEHAAMAKFLVNGPEAARQAFEADPKAMELVNFMDKIKQLNKYNLVKLLKF